MTRAGGSRRRRWWVAAAAIVVVAVAGIAWAVLGGPSGRPARLAVTDAGGLPQEWRGLDARGDGDTLVATGPDGGRVASLTAGARGVTATIDLAAADGLLPAGAPADLSPLAGVADRLTGAGPRLRGLLEQRLGVDVDVLADKLRRAAGGTRLSLTLNGADLRTAAARVGARAWVCAALEVLGRPVSDCPGPGDDGSVTAEGMTVAVSDAAAADLAPLSAPVEFVAGEAAVVLSGGRPAALLP